MTASHNVISDILCRFLCGIQGRSQRTSRTKRNSDAADFRDLIRTLKYSGVAEGTVLLVLPTNMYNTRSSVAIQSLCSYLLWWCFVHPGFISLLPVLIAVVLLYSACLCVSLCLWVCFCLCVIIVFFTDCHIHLFSSLAARVFNKLTLYSLSCYMFIDSSLFPFQRPFLSGEHGSVGSHSFFFLFFWKRTFGCKSLLSLLLLPAGLWHF